MTTVVVGLEEAPELTNVDYTKLVGETDEAFKDYAQQIARIIGANNDTFVMPDRVADAFVNHFGRYAYGRCGLHTVKSAWVKKQYPWANYELVFTLIRSGNQYDRCMSDEVHTLLVYMP